MENNIITDKMYLSEVMDRLPSRTLLNKGTTGCGGTYVELNSPRNSVILVPTRELVHNKSKNGFIVDGKIPTKAIKNYINSDVKYKKIIGTYDSFKRILSVIDDSYFLLVDEYHILFNQYSLRTEAITYLLHNYHKMKDFCFMTATPLSEKIIITELKDLPRINIK